MEAGFGQDEHMCFVSSGWLSLTVLDPGIAGRCGAVPQKCRRCYVWLDFIRHSPFTFNRMEASR